MAFPVIVAALGLTRFAPVIAQWFGGDRDHEAAAKAVNIAQTVTETSDPLEALQKLQSNPDLVAEFQKAIIQADAELELSALKYPQRAHAQDMPRASRSNIRANVMAIGAAMGLIFCVALLSCWSLPGEAVGVIAAIAGILGMCLKDAYHFEFGSSRSSKKKDDILTALVKRRSF